VFVVVIAAAVTAVELTLSAWLPGIYAGLGIFLPLIVTNCLVLARAESFAARNSVWPAMLDALAMGAGFMLVLLALGRAASSSVTGASARARRRVRTRVVRGADRRLPGTSRPAARAAAARRIHPARAHARCRNRAAQRRQPRRSSAIALGDSRA
jgi:hypothetical protein